MGLWRYNIRPVPAHSNVHTVKTARKVRGIHSRHREPRDKGDPVGSEPLDTSVFTAGFAFRSRPGYLFVNHPFPKSPGSTGLICRAQIADKPLMGRIRCRSPPPPPFRFAIPKKIETEEPL